MHFIHPFLVKYVLERAWTNWGPVYFLLIEGQCAENVSALWSMGAARQFFGLSWKASNEWMTGRVGTESINTLCKQSDWRHRKPVTPPLWYHPLVEGLKVGSNITIKAKSRPTVPKKRPKPTQKTPVESIGVFSNHGRTGWQRFRRD